MKENIEEYSFLKNLRRRSIGSKNLIFNSLALPIIFLFPFNRLLNNSNDKELKHDDTIIKSVKIRGFNLERVWRALLPSKRIVILERIDVTFGEKKKRDLQFSCKQSREGVRNKLDNRCFLPSTQKAWHSSLYFSSTTSPQSFSRFSTIPPFPSILFTTRLLLFHLSRLVSLKFPSGLQQPFLHFFPLRSRYISLFFPVFLLLFFPSATTLPFYFFFLLIFLRRGLCFRPPSLFISGPLRG